MFKANNLYFTNTYLMPVCRKLEQIIVTVLSTKTVMYGIKMTGNHRDSNNVSI